MISHENPRDYGTLYIPARNSSEIMEIGESSVIIRVIMEHYIFRPVTDRDGP